MKTDPVWILPPNPYSLVELCCVGGEDAGRLWALGMGVHTLGPGPDSTVHIPDPSFPDCGLRLTVTGSSDVLLAFAGVVQEREADEPEQLGQARLSAIRAAHPARAGSGAAEPAGTAAGRQGATAEFVWPEGAELRFGASAFRLVRMPRPGRTAFAPSEERAPGLGWRTALGRLGGKRGGEEPGALQGIATSTLSGAKRLEAELLEEQRNCWAEAPDPATLAREVLARGAGPRWSSPEPAVGLPVRIGSADRPSTGADSEDREGGWILPGLPRRLDLAQAAPLGLHGPRRAVRALARWLVLQTAVLNGPDRLNLRFLSDPEAGSCWDWAALLPQSAEGPRDAGQRPSTADPRRTGGMIRELITELEARKGGVHLERKPRIVVVLDSAQAFLGLAEVNRLIVEGPSCRIHPICLGSRLEDLPVGCVETLHVESDRLRSTRQARGALPDLVTEAWSARLAAALAAGPPAARSRPADGKANTVNGSVGSSATTPVDGLAGKLKTEL